MNTITDKSKIEQILQGFMLALEKQSVPFLHEIKLAGETEWNGKQISKGGLIIVGARPMSAVTFCETGEKKYNLTNSDSNYTRTIGQIRLQDIEAIVVRP